MEYKAEGRASLGTVRLRDVHSDYCTTRRTSQRTLPHLSALNLSKQLTDPKYHEKILAILQINCHQSGHLVQSLDRSNTDIQSSNPAQGTDVCLF
jgi:hypothetical protein